MADVRVHVYFELFKHIKLSLWRFEVNKVIHGFKVAISKSTFYENCVSEPTPGS